MSVKAHEKPIEFNSHTIVDGYDLIFDPGDPLNGSLYLCAVRGPTEISLPAMVTSMRGAGLWSGDVEKQVADDQREAYKDGLDFVAAIAYRVDAGHIVIARFDHPKFPSDSGRWEGWVEFFDRSYERVGYDD